jgi:ribosomal-protein-alanine N-acetyltransferase
MWSLKRKPLESAGIREISTDRLIVRPATKDDYPQWEKVRRRNYAYLKPYEPTWPKNCLEREFFERRVDRLLKDWQTDQCYAFLIFLKNGDLIGGMNINNVTRGAGQFASLGYWLDEQEQGKGYMREAGQAVLRFAFETLFLQRMNAACLTHNTKSQNLLKSLGFEEEGFAKAYIQIDGKRQDHILFGLNAPDFSGTSRFTRQ